MIIERLNSHMGSTAWVAAARKLGLTACTATDVEGHDHYETRPKQHEFRISFNFTPPRDSTPHHCYMRFRLSYMPSCCGAIVLHEMAIVDSDRPGTAGTAHKHGIGTFLLRAVLREMTRYAKEGSWGAIVIATTTDTQVGGARILEKNGFTACRIAKNPRTGRTITVWTAELGGAK